MDAFDADVLIYAASPDHLLGQRVRRLFTDAVAPTVGIGSVLLLSELLAKPRRVGATEEVAALAVLLGRWELLPVDGVTADTATGLAAA